ncbi:MAG: ABC transporter permease [Gemmatimonadetes bacterium]|nr:ABC transporter permease [Gemmatimonadota bacterium]
MPLHPPAIARLLLRLFVRDAGREFVVGDLDEEYRRYVLPKIGPRLARRWYWWQAIRTVSQYRAPSKLAKSPQTHHGTRRKGNAFMSTLFIDLRFALRTLKRSPGFAALVVLTLSLGIGANTAIFSAVNEVMLRPLTFADSDRLVVLWESNAERGWQQVHAAPANVADWRERVSAFADVASYNSFGRGATLTGQGEAVYVTIGTVSGNLFSVLGVGPSLGRVFTMDETWAESQPVALLSHGMWQRQFGGDPTVVGRTILLDGVSHEVVGVMPDGFTYEFNEAELWVPFRWTTARRESIWFRQAHVVRGVARLAPGITPDQAQVELQAVALQLQQEHPELNRGMDAGLTPIHRFLVGDRRVPLTLLLGAVILLQLIACANVGNLLLARAVGRRQELAMRTALGAGRSRLARQLMTESTVIAGFGAILGLGLGAVLVRWMASLQPPNLPALVFRLDWRVLAFTLTVTAGSALLFGLAPMVRTLRLDLTNDLGGGGSRGGSSNLRQRRATGSFTVVQLALAMMLVIGAGLMLRSLAELRDVDSGVDPTNVLTFAMTPPRGSYPTDRERAEFTISVVDRLRAIPGVRDVGAVRRLALQGGGWTSDFTIEGWGPDEFGIDVKHREATPGYFRSLGVPVLAGRLFPERLVPGEPVPVVVNRVFVERYFPDESPVGRRITYNRIPDENSYWYTIVGVVGNERHRVADAPEPEIIAHLRGDMPGTPRIAIKTAVDPLSIVPAVRAAVAELDSDIPLVSIQTMEQVVGAATARERFLVNLLGVFAVLALGLACVGVYGVAAEAARSRVHEVGIRIALGASESDIVRGFLRRAAGVVAVGLGLGLAGAVAGTRLMSSLLYGVGATDPVTFVAVPLLLTVMVLVSSYLPARRASTVDPATVLRAE